MRAACATYAGRNSQLPERRAVCELGGARARSFATAETLEPKDRKAYLRTLLYPARFCYSWTSGLIGSNEDAMAFLSKKDIAGLDIGLIECALQCRQSAADPDALFPARKVLPSQIDACAALLSAGGGLAR
jgi:hypothetical protein